MWRGTLKTPNSSNRHLNGSQARGPNGHFRNLVTARILCGAGAETLVLVTSALEKMCQVAKRKTAVYTQKAPKNEGLGIRRWHPNLSGVYQNCGLVIHRRENRSQRNSGSISKVYGGSSASSVYKPGRDLIMELPAFLVFKQQSEGSLAEDPSTQESPW